MLLFLLGLFVGGFVGVLVMACLVAGAQEAW